MLLAEVCEEVARTERGSAFVRSTAVVLLRMGCGRRALSPRPNSTRCHRRISASDDVRTDHRPKRRDPARLACRHTVVVSPCVPPLSASARRFAPGLTCCRRRASGSGTSCGWGRPRSQRQVSRGDDRRSIPTHKRTHRTSGRTGGGRTNGEAQGYWGKEREGAGQHTQW